LERNSKKDIVLIVDALNLFTRHFVAHPATGENGQHVGGIVGFLYALTNFAEMYRPESIVVVWEGGGSKKKRDLYKDYKQRRRPAKLNRFYDGDIPDTVENRNHQISVLIKILENTPIIQIYVPDCEADDVIGYISKYTYKDTRKLIVSSDKDFYQLLDSKTIIYSPTWKKLVTSLEVTEKFGISPENFCLAKAVCGDPSDNINGVKGAGFKSLAKRFSELRYDDTFLIDDLIRRCNEMISEGVTLKIIENIQSSEKLIRRNWRLMYLDTQNLASSQINKIENIIDTFNPSRNKINVMRILLKEGIQKFNVDRMFLSFKFVGQ
jgi:DNA polymerase-1